MISDVDECLTEGGRNGHHCHGNTFCVNTIGAYRCQCAGGHKKGRSDDSSDDSCEGSAGLILVQSVMVVGACLLFGRVL